MSLLAVEVNGEVHVFPADAPLSEIIDADAVWQVLGPVCEIGPKLRCHFGGCLVAITGHCKRESITDTFGNEWYLK